MAAMNCTYSAVRVSPGVGSGGGRNSATFEASLVLDSGVAM